MTALVKNHKQNTKNFSAPSQQQSNTTKHSRLLSPTKKRLPVPHTMEAKSRLISRTPYRHQRTEREIRGGEGTETRYACPPLENPLLSQINFLFNILRLFLTMEELTCRDREPYRALTNLLWYVQLPGQSSQAKDLFAQARHRARRCRSVTPTRTHPYTRRA